MVYNFFRRADKGIENAKQIYKRRAGSKVLQDKSDFLLRCKVGGQSLKYEVSRSSLPAYSGKYENII